MKTIIKSVTKQKTFIPFVVEIKVETIEEARLMYHLFNRGHLNKAIMNKDYAGYENYNQQVSTELGGNGYTQISEEIKKQGFDI